jgi:hypothetical protein
MGFYYIHTYRTIDNCFGFWDTAKRDHAATGADLTAELVAKWIP